MDWLLFPEGELRGFIKQVQAKSNLNLNDLAQLVGVSTRTLRDWRREKYKPSNNLISKLSELSGVALPAHKVILQQEHIRQAAKAGGRRRCELYGPPGTIEGWSKGGITSWLRRKNNPELRKIYVKQFKEPEESVELAEFIGIMLGDGGMTPSQCSIYLNSEIDKEYADYVSALVYKLFNVAAHIYKHKTVKVLRVSISGVNLIKYLTLNGLTVGNKVRLQVGVPKWIWSKSEYIKACIRGLIDTDGSFIIHRYKVKGKEYSYPRISFSNKSEPLLVFVSIGLTSAGFTPKRTNKFEVCLYNQTEVIRYLKEIGVSNYKPAVKKIMEGCLSG